MQNLFLKQAQVAAQSDRAKTTGVMPPVPSDSKLDEFEKELRNDVMDTDISLSSQAAGTAGRPTPEQQRMINRYDPQTRNYNYYKSALGDYSMQLGQMTTDHYRATAAMQLSTMENSRGKMGPPPRDEYRMLTTRTNTQKSSDANMKKAKKNPKLSGTDSWL